MMKIRLIEEMFRLETYNLDITDKALIFSKDKNNEKIILFEDIKHFSLEGKGEKLRRFILETASGVYEGVFLIQEDANIIIHKLREKCGCYVDIRLDME